MVSDPPKYESPGALTGFQHSVVFLIVHRYIHEVLQMYDAGESSDSGAASDSSWDDPEHKNLFDHL